MPPNYQAQDERHQYGVYNRNGSSRENWGNSSSGGKADSSSMASKERLDSSSQGIDSARRFLLGEDENERPTVASGQRNSFKAPPPNAFKYSPKQRGMFGSGNRNSKFSDEKNANLMGPPPVRSSGSHPTPPAKAFSWVSGSTKADSYGDASASGDGDEYLATTGDHRSTPGYRCARLLRLCLSPLIALSIVLAMVLITRKMIFDNEDFIQEQRIDEERYTEIRDKLVELFDSYQTNPEPNATVIDISGSPQNNALQWLAYQDPARLNPSDFHLRQRYILAVFFFSTSGQLQLKERPVCDWKVDDHWMTGRAICKWHGVHCIGHSGDEYEHLGDVLSLNLTNNEIEGTLPVELQALTKLDRFDLSENFIKGSIPTEYGLFTSLRDLFLRDNSLVGTIPTELGSLSLIRDLHLGENKLSGSIPTELRSMTRLRALGLNRNQLVGKIPEFATLTSLSVIPSLGLPDTYPHLSWLEYLYLDNNKLTGNVPESLGALTSLKKLYLQSNKLSGIVPESFYHLKHIQDLRLQDNDLTGAVSSKVCDLRSHTLSIFIADCEAQIECECCTRCT